MIANMTVVALPDISIDLGFSADTILWVNLIYLMSFVAFSMPFAKIISQHGVKKCIKISIIALFISIILSVIAVNYYIFLISRLIQGLTSAALAICLYVLIVEEFSNHELGSALGIVSSAGYVGMLVALSFMGFMIYLVNWRTAFLIMIPILLILLFALTRIKSEWYLEKKPIDNIGSLLYIIIMILFTYGITEMNGYGGICLLFAFVLIAVFIKIEKSFDHPIVDFKILKDARFVIGNYAALATYFVTTITITALSFHLQYILNIEEYIVGLILIIAPIIMIGMSNVAGFLSNRFDPRLISGIAMFFLFISMCIYFVLDYIPFELILVACALQGIGNGLFSAPNNKYVLTLVESKHLADASSILSTSKEFGKILSSGIFTLILSVFIGNQSLGQSNLDYLLIQSINLMMFVCVLITFSAIVLLIYNKYKYDLSVNIEVVEFFKSIAPKWLKK